MGDSPSPEMEGPERPAGWKYSPAVSPGDTPPKDSSPEKPVASAGSEGNPSASRSHGSRSRSRHRSRTRSRSRSRHRKKKRKRRKRRREEEGERRSPSPSGSPRRSRKSKKKRRKSRRTHSRSRSRGRSGSRGRSRSRHSRSRSRTRSRSFSSSRSRSYRRRRSKKSKKKSKKKKKAKKLSMSETIAKMAEQLARNATEAHASLNVLGSTPPAPAAPVTPRSNNAVPTPAAVAAMQAAARAKAAEITAAAEAGTLNTPVASTPADLLAQQRAQQYACRIYVGNIMYTMGDDDLRRMFSRFGPIRNITLTEDPLTGHHKGFAFVEFAFPEAAQQALENMQGFQMGGRTLKVGRPSGVPAGIAVPPMPPPAKNPTIPPSIPTSFQTVVSRQIAAATAAAVKKAVKGEGLPTTSQSGGIKENSLYVGSIQYELTAEDVKEAFSKYGKILRCNLMPSPDNAGQHKGFGFIEYETRESADKALEEMDGSSLGNRNIKVGRAASASVPAGAITPKVASTPLIVPNMGVDPQATRQSVLPPPSTVGAQVALAQARAQQLALQQQQLMRMGGMPAGARQMGLSPLQMTSPMYMQQNAHVQQQSLIQQQILRQQIAMSQGLLELGTGDDESIASEDSLPLVGRNQRHALMAKLAQGKESAKPAVSRVVMLENMVTQDDVDSDLEGEIEGECAKYGIVAQVHIDTLRKKVAIFVLFTNIEGAVNAAKALDGRWFAGRTVKASFAAEEHFHKLVK